MDMYKVRAEEGGNFLICKKWNDVHEYLGDTPILVTLIDMTDEESEKLPESTGFQNKR